MKFLMMLAVFLGLCAATNKKSKEGWDEYSRKVMKLYE